MTSAALPKGPWQNPIPTLAVCTLHKGYCAYRTGDPERCDYCHVSWEVVTGTWREDKDQHVADHIKLLDKRTAASLASKATKEETT